jgi:hypothetical protein
VAAVGLPQPPLTLTHPPSDGFDCLLVTQEWLEKLIQGHMIDNSVVYASLATVAAEFPEYCSSYAVLTSNVYSEWLLAADFDRVFRLAKDSRFWLVDALVIPIHHETHWMAALVTPRDATVCFFDSFADADRVEYHGGVHANPNANRTQPLTDEV